MHDCLVLCKLTADPPKLALRELLTCRFCFQEQATEFHSMKVYSRAQVAHFELLEHCLYQLHQLRTYRLHKNDMKWVI